MLGFVKVSRLNVAPGNLVATDNIAVGIGEKIVV